MDKKEIASRIRDRYEEFVEADYTLNVGKIKEVIDSTVSDERLAEGRDRARRETWANPGEAASRTVDYMLEKLSEVKTPS